MNRLLLPTLCLSLLAACGGDAPAQPAGPTGGQAPAAADHGHGTPHPLGDLTIGAHTFRVVQEGDLHAGAEAVFTLEFPTGKPRPEIVRVWVGVESGQGSMKARMMKEGNRELHNHVEVPNTLPEGSKVWVEIEENGQKARAAIDWHR
ncbi:MAG: hypothetical protein JNL08_00370 [Planctomycetes bacterium]|nr:hypothetical protein [Planctomycetota bacterium]